MCVTICIHAKHISWKNVNCCKIRETKLQIRKIVIEGIVLKRWSDLVCSCLLSSMSKLSCLFNNGLRITSIFLRPRHNGKGGNGPQSRYCVVPKLPDYISLWCVCKGTAKPSLPPLVGIRFMNVCDQVRHQQVNVNPPDSYAVSPLVFGTRTCCFPHGCSDLENVHASSCTRERCGS